MGRSAKSVADSFAYPPRGLSRDRSAAYIGVSPTKFDEMVDDGRMPKPKHIDKRVVWDRYALDLAFEALDEHQDDEITAARKAWDHDNN